MKQQQNIIETPPPLPSDFNVFFKFYFRVFAANICSKIAEMIEDIATPVHLKLQLIPIMKNMYHDSSTAAKVVRYTHITISRNVSTSV